MENVCKYLSYIEATKSDTAIKKGIKNIPDEKQLNAMKYVGTKLFDPVREMVGAALHANSFFRSPALNTAIGTGANKSQHCNGEAIDIDADRYGNSDNKTIFYWIKDNLVFDQLIWEHGDETHPEWVHASLVDEKVKGRKNRMQVLRAYNEENEKGEIETKYVAFDYSNN